MCHAKSKEGVTRAVYGVDLVPLAWYPGRSIFDSTNISFFNSYLHYYSDKEHFIISGSKLETVNSYPTPLIQFLLEPPMCLSKINFIEQ